MSMTKLWKGLSFCGEKAFVMIQTFCVAILVSVPIFDIFMKGEPQSELITTAFGIWAIGWIIYLSRNKKEKHTKLDSIPSVEHKDKPQKVNISPPKWKEVLFRFTDNLLATILGIALTVSLLLPVWYSFTE